MLTKHYVMVYHVHRIGCVWKTPFHKSGHILVLYKLTNYKFYVVPIPNVNVSVTEPQIVGQSLTLECSVTTVRGITSRVDIVWSIDGVKVEMIERVNITILSETYAMYEAVYHIPLLSTSDDGRVYQCKAVVNTNPPVMGTDDVILDVIGNSE